MRGKRSSSWMAAITTAAFLGCVLPCVATSHAADTGASHGVLESPGVILGGDITLSGARNTVLAMAGSVAVTDAHMNNLATMGGNIQIVSGDIGRLAVAGGTVSLDGGLLGDVVAAAGDLKVNSRVDGNLRAMAGTIVLTKDSIVGGDAFLTGGDVVIDGVFKNDLTVRGDRISLAGTVGGTVRMIGNDITIAPGTRVNGDLIYSGPAQLTVPADAVIGGAVKQQQAGEHRERRPRSSLQHIAHTAWIVGGLILCGAVLWLVIPPVLAATEAILVASFPLSVLTGLIAICALPIAMALLIVTVIGIPLAVLAAAAAAVVTGLGMLAVCRWIGEELRQRLGQPLSAGLGPRIGWVLVGFLVFIVAGAIPVIGGLAQAVAVFGGGGAVLLTLWQRRRGQPA